MLYTYAANVFSTTPEPTLNTPSPTNIPYYLSDSWQPAQETPPINIDFDKAIQRSEHVVAWLFSEGSVINYPVVVYSNNTYYLSHDYSGVNNKSGAIFFDERNTSYMIGENLILYGHHMKDRSMFGSIMQYQKQTYLDEHKTLYLLTPEKNYRITVFSAWFCDADAANYPIWFSSSSEKRQFYERAVSQSIADAKSEYYADARIISLVTCAYSEYIENAHFQVNGWLTEIG